MTLFRREIQALNPLQSNKYSLPNIPNTSLPRLVVVGAGFGGLKLIWDLIGKGYQIVLIDKHNYHQFQPLYYQVATAGLEPSSISFPLRKVFHKKKDLHIRLTELQSVHPEENYILTGLGKLSYDHLVLATGVSTNFFGLENVAKNAIPMKSVGEALYLRNRILSNFEEAINLPDQRDREQYFDIVVVGGGPTGVEVCGALSEMRKYVLPVDFPELDFKFMDITLLEAGPRLLPGMTERSSAKAKKYLEKMNVRVELNARVTDYDGKIVKVEGRKDLETKTLIWAAGVAGRPIKGMESAVVRGGRLKVDLKNRVEGSENIYALGDIAYMEEEKFPKGHPQVAQVAIQQGSHMARNFRQKDTSKWKDFSYKDLGSMATVGRNLAVCDLPIFSFYGFFAWVFWLLVHLMQILGVKNRLFIFLNWAWSYFTFDQSLRLILKQGDD